MAKFCRRGRSARCQPRLRKTSDNISIPVGELNCHDADANSGNCVQNVDGVDGASWELT